MTANILIAEDNDISREMMAAVLKTRGYTIIDAIDGQSAIESVRNRNIDLALVDINMVPKGGFQFIEYLVAQGVDIPIVIVTGDDFSDILVKSSALGVTQVIQKPIDPDRLIQTVQRILKRRGVYSEPLAVQVHETAFSPEDLMRRAIALAEQNVRTGKGRPFGAVLADQNGRVLGEGVNGIASRADPTAHAEVMAIRQAAEKLRRADLSDCILYSTGEPTMMGKALIASVGITRVYYGLTHGETGAVPADKNQTEYVQLCHDEALAVFKTGRPRD